MSASYNVTCLYIQHQDKLKSWFALVWNDQHYDWKTVSVYSWHLGFNPCHRRCCFWPPNDFSLSTAPDLLAKLSTKVRTNIDEEIPVIAKDVLPYSPVWGGYNVILMSSSWGYSLGSYFWTFPYDWNSQMKFLVKC